MRIAPALGFAALCLYLVADQLDGVSVRDILNALAGFSAADIAAAILFCALSHLALACYDMPSVALLGRRPPWPRVMKGGLAGAVIAQSVGLGALTGAYARWRVYRANGFSPGEVAALSAMVSFSFAIGAATLTALLTSINPAPIANLTGVSADAARLGALFAFAATVSAFVFLSSCRRLWRFRSFRLSPPGWRWFSASVLLTLADLVPAGLCLAAFLPAEATPDLATYLTIYIAATAIGHLVGTPGGIGPFEALLFFAMPGAAAADLAAAVLAYRAVYYLAPLIPASLILLFAPRTPETALATGDEMRDRIDWIADLSDNAEAGLADLGDKRIFAPSGCDAFAMYGVSGRIWLLMGAPVGPRPEWSRLIDGLEAEAKAAGATLAVYKCAEQDAAFWRGRRYRLSPLGVEGRVDAQSFSLDGAPRRELRRKIRGVAKAGLTIRRHMPGEAPLSALAPVASAWRADKTGAEQRFSMGCWNEGYLHRRRIVSGWIGGQPVAFLSLLTDGEGREWMLDLMRQTSDAPAGTMHALTTDAIGWARNEGADCFNLCMAPLSGLDAAGAPQGAFTWVAAQIYRRFGARFGLIGMRRFKDSFRPEWTPRHLAVRNLLDAPEALLAARRLVTGAVPAPVRPDPRSPQLPSLPAPAKADWAEERASPARSVRAA